MEQEIEHGYAIILNLPMAALLVRDPTKSMTLIVTPLNALKDQVIYKLPLIFTYIHFCIFFKLIALCLEKTAIHLSYTLSSTWHVGKLGNMGNVL